MEYAKRLSLIPPYPFAELDRKIAAKKKKGVDLISLGIGDPVEGTPEHIVQAAAEALNDPALHRYPSYVGREDFREAVAAWYENKYDVPLDPEREILSLIGAKEGIAHAFFAFMNPGDIALAPNPGYPVYRTGCLLANGTPYPLPLKEENGFFPDFSKLPEEVARKAKLIFLNYPNMPTAATAEREDFEQAFSFAEKHDLLICHDFPYSEFTYDGFTAPSFLEVDKEKKRTIEFHSLSKTYNMTGWRIGWVSGSAWAIEGLKQVKTNIDSGVFEPIQKAAIAALTGTQTCVEEMRRRYRKRRDSVVALFRELGWKIEPPKGSIYVWLPVPGERGAAEFASELLEKTGVVVTPGTAFGEHGEGYFRISLTVEDARLQEALQRIRSSGVSFIS